MKLTTSLTALRLKCARLSTQDNRWIAFLPPGWFSTQQAAFLWNCTHPHAYRRLALLRCAGRLRQMERRGLWCVAELEGEKGIMRVTLHCKNCGKKVRRLERIEFGVVADVFCPDCDWLMEPVSKKGDEE